MGLLHPERSAVAAKMAAKRIRVNFFFTLTTSFLGGIAYVDRAPALVALLVVPSAGEPAHEGAQEKPQEDKDRPPREI
jgi:hypothetical protein